MAQLVVTPALVALVERAVQLARLARTLRRCLAGLAVSAVTLAQQGRARWVLAEWMEFLGRAAAVQAALAERVEQAAMLVLEALAAVVPPGRAVAVVLA